MEEEVEKIEEVEEIIEEIPVFVPKFTRPDVIEELTQGNIKDIIISQEIEIENLSKEIERKKACIDHYNQYFK